MQQLPFRHKLQLLCTAAASGSEVNLEVALALLRPSVFPGLLQSWQSYEGPDPGVAAVKAGRPQLLGWLLHHCPALVNPQKVLEAAWLHCNLAGLKMAWEALQGGPGGSNDPLPVVSPLGVFEQSIAACFDAIAKSEWLDAVVAESSVDGEDVLLSALRNAGQAIAVRNEALRDVSLQQAASSSDGVEKLQIVRALGADDEQLLRGLPSALEAGQMEVVHYLLSLPGAVRVLQRDTGQLAEIAARSGSIPLLVFLRDSGLVLTHVTYVRAARAGSVGLVRWLACEGGVSAAGLPLEKVVGGWPSGAAADNRDLLEAVQLLVEAAGCRDWDAGAVLCAAARRGSLSLWQYLWSQRAGFPLGEDALVEATRAGCEALLETLVQQSGCRGGTGGQLPYLIAAQRGDRATLDALRRLGVQWGAQDLVFQAACINCPLPAVVWLLEHGAPGCSAEQRESVLGLLG